VRISTILSTISREPSSLLYVVFPPPRFYRQFCRTIHPATVCGFPTTTILSTILSTISREPSSYCMCFSHHCDFVDNLSGAIQLLYVVSHHRDFVDNLSGARELESSSYFSCRRPQVGSLNEPLNEPQASLIISTTGVIGLGSHPAPFLLPIIISSVLSLCSSVNTEALSALKRCSLTHSVHPMYYCCRHGSTTLHLPEMPFFLSRWSPY
jgi:hypothetical protein